MNFVRYFEFLMYLKFYVTIGIDCWNWYLINDGEILKCYCELIGIGLNIFRVDVCYFNWCWLLVLLRLIVHTDTQLRILFEDKYVCGLQTNLRIVPFLDNLRMVFSYKLCCIFQLLFIFHVYISVVSPLYSVDVDYILFKLHT